MKFDPFALRRLILERREDEDESLTDIIATTPADEADSDTTKESKPKSETPEDESLTDIMATTPAEPEDLSKLSAEELRNRYNATPEGQADLAAKAEGKMPPSAAKRGWTPETWAAAEKQAAEDRAKSAAIDAKWAQQDKDAAYEEARLKARKDRMDAAAKAANERRRAAGQRLMTDEELDLERSRELERIEAEESKASFADRVARQNRENVSKGILSVDPRSISIGPGDQERWRDIARRTGSDINTVRAMEINAAIKAQKEEDKRAREEAHSQQNRERLKRESADVRKFQKAFGKSEKEFFDPELGASFDSETMEFLAARKRLQETPISIGGKPVMVDGKISKFDVSKLNPDDPNDQAILRRAVAELRDEKARDTVRSVESFNTSLARLKARIGEEEFNKRGFDQYKFNPNAFVKPGDIKDAKGAAFEGLLTSAGNKQDFAVMAEVRRQMNEINSNLDAQERAAKAALKAAEKAARSGNAPAGAPASSRPPAGAPASSRPPAGAPSSPSTPTAKRTSKPGSSSPSSFPSPSSSAPQMAFGGSSASPTSSRLAPSMPTQPTQSTFSFTPMSYGSPGSNTVQLAQLMQTGDGKSKIEDESKGTGSTTRGEELLAFGSSTGKKPGGLAGERFGALRATGSKTGKGQFTSNVVKLAESIRFKRNEMKMFLESAIMTPAQSSVTHKANKLILADIDMGNPGLKTETLMNILGGAGDVAKKAIDIKLLPPHLRAANRLMDIGLTKKSAAASAKYYAKDSVAQLAAIGSLSQNPEFRNSKAGQFLLSRLGTLQGKKIGGLVGGISQKAMDALGGESLMKARLGVELASIFGGDDRIRGMVDPMEISSSLEDDKRQEQEDYLRKLKQDELEARRRARLTP